MCTYLVCSVWCQHHIKISLHLVAAQISVRIYDCINWLVTRRSKNVSFGGKTSSNQDLFTKIHNFTTFNDKLHTTIRLFGPSISANNNTPSNNTCIV